MPIYEYACDACGGVVEVLQRLSDPPLTECPSGDRGRLRRVLSAHNVGGAVDGWQGGGCERSQAPSCGGCGQAGTGCG